MKPKKATLKFLFKTGLILISSIIASISLYKFWNFDLVKIQFTPFLLVNLTNQSLPAILPYLLLGIFLAVITSNKKNLRLESSILLFISAISQILIIYTIQKYSISFKTVSLLAATLSSLLCVYFYIWLEDINIERLFENKYLPYLIFFSFTLIYTAFVLVRHYSFNSNGQDLGVYIQSIYELGHSKNPRVTNWYDITHPFAIHFEPILYFFIPFQYLGILPPALLIIQVLGVTLGILGIFKIAEHFKLPQFVPVLVSVAYALSPSIQHGLVFDFHTTMLMPSFIIFIFYFIIKRDTKKTFILILLFLLLKEDAAVYTIFFGLFILGTTRNIKLGSLLITIGVIYGYLAVAKIIPSFSKGGITNFVFDRLGDSIPEVISNSAKNPVFALKIFLSPIAEKGAVIASTLLQGGFLVFWGYKELLLLIPLFSMRFFTGLDRMWGFSMYYAAPTAAVIAVATIVGFAKYRFIKKKEYTALISLVYGTVFSFLLGTMIHIPGYYSSSIFRKIIKSEFFSKLNSKETKTTREAIKQIPKKSNVCSSQGISAHLSTRSKTTFLGSSVCDETYEYFLIDVNQNNWPLSDKDIANHIRMLKQNQKYATIFSREGVVIFSRRKESSQNLSPYLQNWLEEILSN